MQAACHAAKPLIFAVFGRSRVFWGVWVFYFETFWRFVLGLLGLWFVGGNTALFCQSIHR